MPTRIALAGLALLTLLLMLAPAARAGSYEVRACDGSGINRAFSAVGSDAIAADASCSADWSLGMKVRNQVGRGTLPAFTWGALEAQAPPGAVITGLRGNGTAFGTQGTGLTSGGWEAGVADDSGYRWCGLPAGCSWAGPAALPFAVGGLSTSRVRVLVICSSGGGCPTGSVRAAATLRDAVIELRDDGPPEIGRVQGALGSGGWTAGTASGSFSASDPTGIRRTRIEVDGTPVFDRESSCDPYSMRPCPDAGGAATLDTRHMADGGHELVATAWDAAGNASVHRRTLQVDNTAPGPAQMSVPARWVRDGTQAVVTVRPGTAGPSGVAGYALTTDGSEPGSSANAAGPVAEHRPGPLAEGLHHFRARAIGGTGIAAREDASVTVGVDRTAPSVSVEAVGDGGDGREDWIRGPAQIAVSGTDQAALSGMEPSGEGLPVEAGGYVEYQADSEPAVRVKGGSARFSFSRDGVHAVTVRAVDGAGNASGSRTASFRVDSKIPSGALEHPAREDPRRLRATVDEGCIAAATLEMRALAGGGWEKIDGRAAPGSVSALVPDDRLPGGRYEARFRVTDCAGNEGIISSFSDGQPGVVTLPLRMRPRLAAALVDAGGHETARLVAGREERVAVSARLLDDGGEPMEGNEIEVRQRIGSGGWQVVARAETGASGRVGLRVPAGPSRALQVVALDTRTSTGATSDDLAVEVAAQATIRAARRRLRNGQSARLSGRVLGGFLPARGRELELQGWNPSRRRWQPVLTEGLRCDGSGRWKARYRFSATVGGTVAYRFRVRVAPRPDHPFAEGHSRAVTVRVSG